MKIYVILFTIIWSQMSDGYIHDADICVDRENQVLKNQKQCESCSCENLSTNDVCTLEFCPCLKILCSQSSKLEDLSQKPEVENISNSNIKMKNDWHEDLNNTDKHGRNNVTADNTFIFSPDFTLQMDKIYKQNTEREQNKSKSERYLGTGMLIRLLSIDYAMPVTKSDTDLYAVFVVLLYCTTIAIGITICIIVYRKYGYDKREHERSIIIDNPIQRHLTKSGDFDRDIPKEGTATKSLLDDPPPSYEKCVV